MVRLASRTGPSGADASLAFCRRGAGASRERDLAKGRLPLKVTCNLPRIADDPPYNSPTARARRRDGGEFHDRHRSDDRLDRHAADRRPARRPASLQLGVLGVPSDPDRDHRGVRQARRQRRSQDGDADRDRGLPRRLDPVRVRLVDAVADRLPAHSGRRRRRGPADRDDHRRRPLFRPRAGEDPGLARERVGAVGGARAVGRRPHHPAFLLGLDLLDEPADRGARRGGILGLSAREARPPRRQDRSLERWLVHHRYRRDHGRPHRVFDFGPVRDLSHHRGRGGRGRSVRDPGAPVSRADDLARALGQEADRRRQRRVAPLRHGDDRAHHVSAGIRSGSDGGFSAHRRLRPLGDGARMAGRRHLRGALLQALRRPRRPPHRGPAGPGRRAGVRRPDRGDFPIRRRARIACRRARDGPSVERLDHPHSGDRRLVGARQRDRVLSVRAEPRQHLRGDGVRRGAQFRPPAVRRRRHFG